jgi:SPP1 family predicted phage head-tail adaptor
MKLRLNKRIEVFGPVQKKNELGQDTNSFEFLKTIWAEVKVIGGNAVESEDGKTIGFLSHQIRCRKKSIDSPTSNMYFMHDGLKLEIEYFQPDYKNNSFWEFKCKVVIE